MKRQLYLAGLCFALLLNNACSKKYDNYPEPDATLTGSITDLATGKPVQTEAGSNGARIRLDELSWSATPTPYYFYAMQDGTYRNTKIFSAKYRISVEGAFVPLIQYDGAGNITVDKSQTLDVKGSAKVDFKVEPFLNVDWVSDPVYNSADSTITVKVKFTRGNSNPSFQNNVTDVFLFVNATTYVGNNNYDNRYSNKISYGGTAGNSQIGQTITITTRDKLPGKRSYFIRVGARVDYGLKYYNYTDIKTVAVP